MKWPAALLAVVHLPVGSQRARPACGRRLRGVPSLVTVLRMLLSQSRPEDLVRCAAVFGELVADVARAQSSARESSHVVWHGRAGDAYQHELAALATDLQCVQVAYDEACDVLLRYARGLDLARGQARTAEAVIVTAEAERAAAVVSGGLLWSDSDAGLARGAALLEAAHEAHAQAAAPAIRALEDLAGRVPRTSMGANRFLSQVLRGLGGVVKGTGELAVTAIRSLPLVGSDSGRHAARHELADEAEAIVQPWLLVEQLLQQWRDGQGGQALGAALGMAATHRLGVRAKDAELFGTYAALPDQVVRAVRGVGPDLAGDTWVLARQQQLLHEDLLRLREVPLPVGRQVLAHPVDLLHHEAHGGHTVLKHVGRPVAFLLRRQESLLPWKQSVSSFTSLEEASRAVDRALTSAEVQADLDLWLSSPRPRTTVRVALPGLAGPVLDPLGKPVPARDIVIRLVKGKDGAVLVLTAYLAGA